MLFRKKKPAGNDNVQAPAQPTIIGTGAVFEGSLQTDGEVHVDGRLRGWVRADLCVVTPSGLVEGEIDAEEVIVAGQVIGPVSARHVHLQEGARVEGDITSDTIAVDNGAKLSGAVWHRDGLQTNGHRPVALPPANEPRFAAASLWDQVREDDDRPLKAVHPQR
ncbi:MAG TPA: polymer-forming cytoskeletal protein [Aestuariivirga sp.]|nr:polymer-forming cytoskeletal protein [Aestuariivirga sp.]